MHVIFKNTFHTLCKASKPHIFIWNIRAFWACHRWVCAFEHLAFAIGDLHCQLFHAPFRPRLGPIGGRGCCSFNYLKLNRHYHYTLLFGKTTPLIFWRIFFNSLLKPTPQKIDNDHWPGIGFDSVRVTGRCSGDYFKWVDFYGKR